MILSWKRRTAGQLASKKKELLGEDNLEVEVMIPTHFRCPISLDLMKDPVTLSTGITYDRENIEKWIEAGNQTCPVTNQTLMTFDQIPNHSIRKMIQNWCVENRSSGVERIPTPRIPVTQYEISEICSKIVGATQRGDQKKCHELVGKIKNLGKESERNKKIIVNNGVIGSALSSSFESFAAISMEKHSNLLEEILSILTWNFPLGLEGHSKLGSASSLRCMVEFLRSGDLSTRQNAILVLKDLLAYDPRHVNTLAEVEGFVEGLVSLVKDPICPTATKASLMAIYYMIWPSVISEKIISRVVEMGLVSLILEILVDGEKGLSEKALSVLDGICNSKEGREKAYGDALVVPILVKKILRVSDLATQFSVSILWKLCRNGKGDHEEGVLDEALQVGAFQKLLLVLQVGCGGSTKEKVSELLKLLNLYRGKSGCVDSSMDFKYLKRPF